MDTEIVTVILAGGYATRFWPITKNKPKVLLPIDQDMCVMDKQIKEATEDSRVSDVYVSTNSKFREQILEHIREADYDTPKISVEKTEDEEEKLGVVGALRQFVERENLADKNLMIVAGDNIMDMSLSELLDAFEETRSTYIVTYDIEDKKKASSYGVVGVSDDNHVKKFEEKPENPSSSLVSTACYMVEKDDVMFNKYLHGDNNPDEPGRYMDWLKDRTDMRTYSFNGEWYDIGTPESYIDAVEWWLNGDKYVSSSTQIINSSIGPNTIILDDCKIEDTDLESSVIFSQSNVRNCSIYRSVIDEKVSVNGADLETGIVGNRDN